MSECKRCGKCCFYYPFQGTEYKPGSKELKACKYLHIDINDAKKTVCQIYDHRIGAEIDLYVYCGYRNSIEKPIEGCSQ